MENKTIIISQKDFKGMEMLHRVFYEIYGDEEETVWSIDDLSEMVKIGQDFMGIFAPNFCNDKK